jgi:hypothetical protein
MRDAILKIALRSPVGAHHDAGQLSPWLLGIALSVGTK